MTARPYVRARRAFWTLLLTAVLLVGALSAVLRATPTPLAGAAVATLGALAAMSIALAARLWLALSGHLSPPRDTPSHHEKPVEDS